MTFDWKGVRSVKATMPGGGAYGGVIRISAFGDGLRLDWHISDGVYCGIGLETREGLFVSCGPALEGKSLILFDGSGAGRWLGANTDAEDCGGPSRAAPRGEDVFAFSGSGVRRASLSRHGEAIIVAIETDAGPRDGLAWRAGGKTALALGCPLERLVILFYPTPTAQDGPVDALWTLGRNRETGRGRLTRLG